MRAGMLLRRSSRRSRDARAAFVVATLCCLLFAWLMPCAARADPPSAEPFRLFPLTPGAARALVAAALRASGLDTKDAMLDALAQSARSSAWLPEVRLRVSRTDDDHTTILFKDPTDPYATSGIKMMYEARLSWRLDRIVYSGDEAQIEHLRVVRIEARERIEKKTLETFFALERSLTDLAHATPQSREAEDAGFRAFEAAATLDVMTGGWFSDALRGKVSTR
jgi:hypothetical protein